MRRPEAKGAAVLGARSGIVIGSIATAAIREKRRISERRLRCFEAPTPRARRRLTKPARARSTWRASSQLKPARYGPAAPIRRCCRPDPKAFAAQSRSFSDAIINRRSPPGRRADNVGARLTPAITPLSIPVWRPVSTQQTGRPSSPRPAWSDRAGRRCRVRGRR